MLAVRTVSAETLDYVDLPRPILTTGTAIVRIERVALCGTDLHIWEDDYTSELPLVQGHELSGTVVAVADSENGVSVGDRVAIDPLTCCGSCAACTAGRGNVCPNLSVFGCYGDGGLVEELRVDAARLHRVPDGLSIDLAALAEPASISLQAISRGRATADDIALVLGAGPIGLLAALALHDLGARVLVADTVPDRLELARSFGADAVLLVDPETHLPDIAAGPLAELGAALGATLVIEATGVPQSLENALRIAAPAGRVVQVGISTRPTGFPLHLLAFKEIDLMGSRNSTGLIPEALALIDRQSERVASLLSHRFAVADLDRAFRTMRDRTQRVGKILIEMPPSTPGVGGGERGAAA